MTIGVVSWTFDLWLIWGHIIVLCVYIAPEVPMNDIKSVSRWQVESIWGQSFPGHVGRLTALSKYCSSSPRLGQSVYSVCQCWVHAWDPSMSLPLSLPTTLRFFPSFAHFPVIFGVIKYNFFTIDLSPLTWLVQTRRQTYVSTVHHTHSLKAELIVYPLLPFVCSFYFLLTLQPKSTFIIDACLQCNIVE